MVKRGGWGLGTTWQIKGCFAPRRKGKCELPCFHFVILPFCLVCSQFPVPSVLPLPVLIIPFQSTSSWNWSLIWSMLCLLHFQHSFMKPDELSPFPRRRQNSERIICITPGGREESWLIKQVNSVLLTFAYVRTPLEKSDTALFNNASIVKFILNEELSCPSPELWLPTDATPAAPSIMT